MTNFVRNFIRLFKRIRYAFKGAPGDWMDTPPGSPESQARSSTPKSSSVPFFDYQPDKEFESLQSPVRNPVLAFHEALTCDDPKKLPEDNPFKGVKVAVEEAWVYEGCVNERGALMKDKRLLEARSQLVPFRVRYCEGNAYTALVKESAKLHAALPAHVKKVREAKQQTVASLQKAGFLEDIDFAQDPTTTPFDSAQYTEYTPLYGGPFNKQLYLTDYLTMHARAFEQKNHHPLAKRIIDVLAQYSFGRRFKVRWKDKKKQRVWERFNDDFNFIHRCSEFWIKEYLTYGELMIDKLKWQSIDPSTVWDIITDPDDITDVYYYYQTYSTAYQTFTGFRVPGVPGAQNQEPVKFIIRQIPAHQVMHIKGNVVSQEKRGRSILFPILGWLKRVKDLYDAEVVRAQLQACFLWDDTIKGSAADVQAHIAAYSQMPTKATFFAHNEAIERKPMAAIPNEGRTAQGVSDEILAFIATSVGIPKDFFNIISMGGGGSRATALVGAEPFEKVIEDIQAKFERLLLEVAEEVINDSGMKYEEGDAEFIFPSVTKDTTSETIKNIGIGEEMGYIDHQVAAEMYAGEMNITGFNFDETQARIKKDKAENPDPLMPPASRFLANGKGAPPTDGTVPNDVSPIHGQGKNNLKSQINTL